MKAEAVLHMHPESDGEKEGAPEGVPRDPSFAQHHRVN